MPGAGIGYLYTATRVDVFTDADECMSVLQESYFNAEVTPKAYELKEKMISFATPWWKILASITT